MPANNESALTLPEAQKRLAEVRAGLENAAKKCGRQADEIKLLAVSKTFPAEMVLTYLKAGQLDFGESYIQEARDKSAMLTGADPAPNWHFIGHLQTNKGKYAAGIFSTLHSLDSLDLAAELDKRLAAAGRTMDVYIQVNVAGEIQKSGLEPADFPAFLDSLAQYARLRPVGLMTMPPYDPDPEAARPHFAALRELRDKRAPQLGGLSMGMSGDYAVAIEEGATVIRVGTALFGAR
ncbi:YggS family pyridoxal phosphate-dependent enzyme [Deltaproteobacteria bacterium OttesenSCG-928-K17]|nr:YggS family pyridoxal phosphate-dependent enzyme [Deltaproteobacteria bacterium OttesenSCG-928-K17]